MVWVVVAISAAFGFLAGWALRERTLTAPATGRLVRGHDGTVVWFTDPSSPEIATGDQW